MAAEEPTEVEQLRRQVGELQGQIDLVTHHLSAARALRTALISCDSIGWPVSVQRAFNHWNETLNKLVFIPAAGNVPLARKRNSSRAPRGAGHRREEPTDAQPV